MKDGWVQKTTYGRSVAGPADISGVAVTDLRPNLPQYSYGATATPATRIKVLRYPSNKLFLSLSAIYGKWAWTAVPGLELVLADGEWATLEGEEDLLCVFNFSTPENDSVVRSFVKMGLDQEELATERG